MKFAIPTAGELKKYFVSKRPSLQLFINASRYRIARAGNNGNRVIFIPYILEIREKMPDLIHMEEAALEEIQQWLYNNDEEFYWTTNKQRIKNIEKTCYLEVNGSPPFEVESFSITIENNLHKNFLTAEPEKSQMKNYWLVLCVYSNHEMQRPTNFDQHSTEVSARDEAERLAKKWPGRIYGVFEFKGQVKVTNPVNWEYPIPF